MLNVDILIWTSSVPKSSPKDPGINIYGKGKKKRIKKREAPFKSPQKKTHIKYIFTYPNLLLPQFS